MVFCASIATAKGIICVAARFMNVMASSNSNRNTNNSNHHKSKTHSKQRTGEEPPAATASSTGMFFAPTELRQKIYSMCWQRVLP